MMSDGGQPDSEALADLAFFALDHAVESVVDSGGPLVPFVVVERDGARSLTRGVAETLEAGLQAVQRMADDVVDGRTVVAFDGYLTTDEGRFDAVHVEAREPSGQMLQLAQRYEVKGMIKKKPRPLGNAVLISSNP
jgi:hypothetical protein